MGLERFVKDFGDRHLKGVSVLVEITTGQIRPVESSLFVKTRRCSKTGKGSAIQAVTGVGSDQSSVSIRTKRPSLGAKATVRLDLRATIKCFFNK